jgi:DNA-binding NarL/FixJ family response regulator
MDKLTPRERQIAHLIAHGHRNRAVAEQLGVTTGTVKVHVNNIYAKLGIDNRVTLVRAWLLAEKAVGWQDAAE